MNLEEEHRPKMTGNLYVKCNKYIIKQLAFISKADLIRELKALLIAYPMYDVSVMVNDVALYENEEPEQIITSTGIAEQLRMAELEY